MKFFCIIKIQGDLYMNINSSSGHALVSLLEYANKTNQFLAVKNGRFVLVDNKNEALKSTDINKYSQQIFSKSKNLSSTQKNALAGRLEIANEQYKERTTSFLDNLSLDMFKGMSLNSPTNQFPDIQLKEDLDLGGLPDIQPRDNLGGLPDLNLSGNLQAKRSSQSKIPTQFNMTNPKNLETLGMIEEGTSQVNDPELLQMKLFYGKVMENTGFTDDKLDGINAVHSIKSTLDDLEAYAKKFPEGEVPIKLKKVIDEQKQTYECALLSIGLESGALDKDEINSLVKEFNQRIINLPVSTNENSPCVTLPGGTSEHAVIFQIEKTSANTYSFTIINTGEGGDVVGKNTNDRYVVANTKYSGIKAEDLSPEFLTVLLNKNNFNKMQDVDSLLRGQFPNATKSRGKQHKAQIHGTCTLKSNHKAIRERLGDDLYNNFKFSTTKREFQNLSRLKNEDLSKLLSPEDQAKLDKLLLEGIQVLKRRSNRLSMDYPV